MKSSPVVVMAWEGYECVNSVRLIVGSTNPREADAGTVRGVGVGAARGASPPVLARRALLDALDAAVPARHRVPAAFLAARPVSPEPRALVPAAAAAGRPELATPTSDMSLDCWRCTTHLGRSLEHAMCMGAGCMRGMCVVCWPRYFADDWRCPEHALPLGVAGALCVSTRWHWRPL